MSFFVSKQHVGGKAGSHLALAIALATGSAVVATAFADPAHAMQRKKKDKKKGEEQSAEYSREFVEAYVPLDEGLKAENPDIAALKALVPAMRALAVSQDEQFAGGNLIYQVGNKSGDQSFQLDGLKLMLGSGKVVPQQVGQLNFLIYQLLNISGQNAEARSYLQKAIDANYSSGNLTADQLQVNMAESYFADDMLMEGLAYLLNGISERRAAGMEVNENWYRRGLDVAYNNDIAPQAYDILGMWIGDYPNEDNWRLAINITRNLGDYEAAELLDLLRLGFRVNSLQEKYEYISYIEAADPRRLPKEVEKVIQHGYMTGRISRDDIFISDSLRTATGRIESDETELPLFENDARAADASLRTLVAAGDTFLNYDEADKAEEFYTKAAAMPEADRNLVLTRLGISQVDQGKFEEAVATFRQVEGARAPIANLWVAFSEHEMAANAADTAVEAPAAEVAAATTAS